VKINAELGDDEVKLTTSTNGEPLTTNPVANVAQSKSDAENTWPISPTTDDANKIVRKHRQIRRLSRHAILTTLPEHRFHPLHTTCMWRLLAHHRHKRRSINELLRRRPIFH